MVLTVCILLSLFLCLPELDAFAGLNDCKCGCKDEEPYCQTLNTPECTDECTFRCVRLENTVDEDGFCVEDELCTCHFKGDRDSRGGVCGVDPVTKFTVTYFNIEHLYCESICSNHSVEVINHFPCEKEEPFENYMKDVEEEMKKVRIRANETSVRRRREVSYDGAHVLSDGSGMLGSESNIEDVSDYVEHNADYRTGGMAALKYASGMLGSESFQEDVSDFVETRLNSQTPTLGYGSESLPDDRSAY